MATRMPPGPAECGAKRTEKSIESNAVHRQGGKSC